MLDNIRCEDYGFKVSDLTVAAMVKSYLSWMKPEDAKVTLDNIVSSHRSEYKLDGKELARLIDDAKTAAMMDTAAGMIPRNLLQFFWALSSLFSSSSSLQKNVIAITREMNATAIMEMRFIRAHSLAAAAGAAAIGRTVSSIT